MTRKLCWLILLSLLKKENRRNCDREVSTFFNWSCQQFGERPTLSNESGSSGHETTRNTCQRHYICRCRVNLESIPSKLKPASVVLRQRPCKLNPFPSVCCQSMCFPNRKAKKHVHCQKIVPRLLKTMWQRKAVWLTLFSNKDKRSPSATESPKQLLAARLICLAGGKGLIHRNGSSWNKRTINRQNTHIISCYILCFDRAT